MKAKLMRSLAIVAAPLALGLTVATASAPAASASTSASQAITQSASSLSKAAPAGLPNIWTLECNVITVGKFGVNPYTGQLYRCEWSPELGYQWLPVYICPNTILNAAGRPTKTC